MSPVAAFTVGGLAAAAGAWLLRRTPPFLLSPAGEALPPPPPGFDQRRLEQYARWFIYMRWVSVLLGLVLVVATVGLGFLPDEVLVAEALAQEAERFIEFQRMAGREMKGG